MSQTMADETDDEEDISVLEYARQNKIARNHWIEAQQVFNNIHGVLLQGDIGSWRCDHEPPDLSFGEEYKIEERLSVSKEAAMMLSDVARPDDKDQYFQVVSSMLDTRSSKKLKLSPPILRTDHDLDFAEFYRRDNFEIKLHDIKLPLELVDGEKDEGLSWPKAYRGIGPSIMQNVRNEKMAVNRETIAYLYECTNWSWTAEDEQTTQKSTATLGKRKPIRPLTPPLLAWEVVRPFQPEIGSEGFDLPLMSDPPDLTQFDLLNTQHAIFEQDAPTPFRELAQRQEDGKNSLGGDGTVRMRDIYSPLASFDTSSSPVPVHARSQIQRLKVETPLTPRRPEYQPVDLPEVMTKVQETLKENKSPISVEINHTDLETAFGITNEQVQQELEQESLVFADALCRVEVPRMDFSLPAAPWRIFDKQVIHTSLPELRLQLLNDVFKDMSFVKWTNSRHIAKDLNKAIFDASLAVEAIREIDFSDDSTWGQFTVVDEDVVDSSAVTWKSPGLLICRDDDDDDDIEALDTVLGSLTMKALVKKRKMQMDLKSDSTRRKLDKDTTAKPMQVNGTTVVTSSLLGGPFSAQDSVDMFMELRGSKKSRLSADCNVADREQQISNVDKMSVSLASQQTNILPTTTPQPQISIPTPAFVVPSTPFHIIISANLYTRRHLVTPLERTLLSMNAIERDFCAFNTSEWQPGSVVRSPKISPLAAEADIIISPKVGVIITTLQMIGQTTPPGYSQKTDIRSRVQNVSLRYDLLLVMVGEDNKLGTFMELNSHSTQKLSEFIAYTAGIDGNVMVQYVPGGDKELAQWLMSVIIRHRIDERLLSEETYWELLLRRAGMNAFAAQVVLAMLKAPEGVDPLNPSKAGHFGITAFVEMSRDARIVRFGDVCGRRLIERVSAVIDADWTM